jgi:hypothetical protein
MTLIVPIYLLYLVQIDCCMPTCACTHTKLSKMTCFLGQILNPQAFWDGDKLTIYDTVRINLR